jgi:hypothetical protein
MTVVRDLERELGKLLEQERFEPSEEFRADALIKDLSVHEEAAKDPVAWWAQQAKALHWFKEPEQALDDSNPPFYKWFSDGRPDARAQNAAGSHPRRPAASSTRLRRGTGRSSSRPSSPACDPRNFLRSAGRTSTPSES